MPRGTAVALGGVTRDQKGIRSERAAIGWDDYSSHGIVMETKTTGFGRIRTTTTTPMVEVRSRQGAALRVSQHGPNGEVLLSILEQFEAWRGGKAACHRVTACASRGVDGDSDHHGDDRQRAKNYWNRTSFEAGLISMWKWSKCAAL